MIVEPVLKFLVTAGTSETLRETFPAFTVGYVLVTGIVGTILIRHCSSLEDLVEKSTESRDR